MHRLPVWIVCMHKALPSPECIHTDTCNQMEITCLLNYLHDCFAQEIVCANTLIKFSFLMLSSENLLLEKVNLHINVLLLEVKSQFSPVNKN